MNNYGDNISSSCSFDNYSRLNINKSDIKDFLNILLSNIKL